MSSSVRTKKWYQIQWYSDQDTPEDRKLITRLDLLIVPYAVLSYWIKYVDQSNLNNAYVSGMKEDLGFQGNELVQLQTLNTVGLVVGQLPFLFLFTYVPMHWLIPALDILWGIFTLLQYRVTSYAELAAYRFLVGWFEGPFFPAMHYVFGSWYRGDEIARRGGIFYIGLTLGTLTAGLIQAGASARLDGVNDLAGWRWMYIICAVITLPVGLLGYLVIPGTPDQPNLKILREKDVEGTKKRLERFGHGTEKKEKKGEGEGGGKSFRLKNMLKVFRDARFWGIVVVDVLFWNAGVHANLGVYLIWLKDLGRYSTEKVNELGSLAPGLGILYTLVYCFASDLLLGPAWVMTIATVWNMVGLVIFVSWDRVPESALWLAFSTVYSGWAMSSVVHGWINHILRASPAERSFTLVLVNAFCQSTTAWTPLLVYPTVEGPKYPKGYAFGLGCAILLIGATHLLNMHLRREERRNHQSSAVEESGATRSPPTCIDTESDGKHEEAVQVQAQH